MWGRYAVSPEEGPGAYLAIDVETPTIPPNATVLFLLGEIDCREGILVAVEKLRYESVDEGIRHTADLRRRRVPTGAAQAVEGIGAPGAAGARRDAGDGAEVQRRR